MTAAYILAVATKHGVPQKWWGRSFELCEFAVSRALEGLCKECEARAGGLVEGDLLTDGYFYRERVTILVGLLSAWNLSRKIRCDDRPKEEFLRSFISDNIERVRFWGESAAPLLVLAASQLERFGQALRAENLIAQLIGIVTKANSKRERRGQAPSPYYGPEQAVRLHRELDRENTEEFYAHSYSVESLVHFLARRWRRQAVARVWEGVTRVQFTAFRPSEDWEWFVWRAKGGSLDTKFPTHRQSWAELLEKAEKVDAKSLPPLLREHASFAPYFAVVYPHRFQPALLKLIEEAVAAAYVAPPRLRRMPSLR